MREVSLETLPNVNIRDPSHDKNLPIICPLCPHINFTFSVKYMLVSDYVTKIISGKGR